MALQAVAAIAAPGAHFSVKRPMSSMSRLSKPTGRRHVKPEREWDRWDALLDLRARAWRVRRAGSRTVRSWVPKTSKTTRSIRPGFSPDHLATDDSATSAAASFG